MLDTARDIEIHSHQDLHIGMHQAWHAATVKFGWTARLLDIADIPAHRANPRHASHATRNHFSHLPTAFEPTHPHLFPGGERDMDMEMRTGYRLDRSRGPVIFCLRTVPVCKQRPPTSSPLFANAQIRWSHHRALGIRSTPRVCKRLLVVDVCVCKRTTIRLQTHNCAFANAQESVRCAFANAQ